MCGHNHHQQTLPLLLLQVDIAIPEVFIGGLLGATLVALFSAWSITAVGKSAQEVVVEVRACPQRMMLSDVPAGLATQGISPRQQWAGLHPRGRG